MSDKKSSDERPPSEVSVKRPKKSRKHGYRGYGSGLERGTAGGAVHWGRGFAGVEPLGGGGGTKLPESGLFSEDLKEKVEDLKEDAKEKTPKP